MNQRSEHLSDAQVEDYGDLTSGAGPDADSRVEKHLAECQSCRGRVLQFQRIRMGLLAESNPIGSRLTASSEKPEAVKSNLLGDPTVKTAPSPDCPMESDIRDLAAGLLSGAQASALTQHASVCDRCGPLLRIHTADFSGELDQEEQAALDQAQLESASLEWQRQTARKMMRAAEAEAGDRTARLPARQLSTASKKAFHWKWRLVPAMAAICALVGFGYWDLYVRETPEKAGRLLAETYTEERTVEMRIPDAAHSDFNQSRSANRESQLNLPVGMSKAIDMISRHLKESPDDPRWLILSARLDLLDWNYKPALSTLERITDPQVIESSQFLMTRSLALYEEAEVSKDSSGYFEAVELLGKALQKKPDDPVLLFNQAIACEKIYSYECAQKDWDRFLTIETDSGWSAEARNHLDHLKEKKSLRPQN